jgi:hypothetical protein
MNFLTEMGFEYDRKQEAFVKNQLIIPEKFCQSVLDESMEERLHFLVDEFFSFVKPPYTLNPGEQLIVSNGKQNFDFFQIVSSEIVFKDFVETYLRINEILEN